MAHESWKVNNSDKGVCEREQRGDDNTFTRITYLCTFERKPSPSEEQKKSTCCFVNKQRAMQEKGKRNVIDSR